MGTANQLQLPQLSSTLLSILLKQFRIVKLTHVAGYDPRT